MFISIVSRALAAGALASLFFLASPAPASTLTPRPLNGPFTALDLDDEEQQIDFEAHGMEVIKRAGLADKPIEEISPEDLLETSFLTVRLGIFDLAISKYASEDRKKAGDFIDLGDALLKLQAAFLGWIGESAPGYAEAKKDMKTLASWLKSLKRDEIAKFDDDVRGEISSVLNTPESVLAAQARFGAYMASGAALGLEREGELVEPILLAPDRVEFLELLSSFGLLYPDQQYIYHDSNVLEWTNTYCNDLTVVALEFAEPDAALSGSLRGSSMNSRTPTGMAQQISQLAAGAMLDNLYGSKIPPSLAGAFAVNLVIEIYGECNTRVDGDLKSRRTEAREVFVPGGNPTGGLLPPLLADSRWRGMQGADYYLTGLQGSQAAGAGEGKGRHEKVQYFEIMNDEDDSRMYLRAPFLGTVSAERNLVIPDEFFSDAQEMFRAYRTAFAHWLQTKAVSNKRKGKAAFSELLVTLAQAEPTDDVLEATLEKLYGAPLSSDDPKSKGQLEGDFLVWLSKQ